VRKVYEDRFLKKYKDKSPEEIIEAEGRNALATIAQVREEGRQEQNRLRAAEKMVALAFGEKSRVEQSGEISINITKTVVNGDGD